MPASKAKRAETAARRTRAIELRLAGASWDAIATALGYAGKAAAHKDVTRALEANLAAQSDNADMLRQVELDRLDRLQRGLWQAAAAGDPRTADSVLRIIDRRIRLQGLDVQPDMDEQARRELTSRVGEQMFVVFGQVLDALGLTQQQRAMVPQLMRTAIGHLTGSGAEPRQIEGQVVDAAD